MAYCSTCEFSNNGHTKLGCPGWCNQNRDDCGGYKFKPGCTKPIEVNSDNLPAYLKPLVPTNNNHISLIKRMNMR